MADAHEIEQVLVNFMTNASDALIDGGSLKFSTNVVNIDVEFIKANGYGKLGQYAMLECTDNGPGIGKDVISRILMHS